ncbi:MAG TPA: FAD-dependent oxidoreductase, partial [Actinomycetota bacterium]|nr:FAD-dependent oxidoreductase [Actinomycetota bacterium]
RARVVIIGGGVAGASIAYHLAKMGWKDVLLLDRSELTSGSTFHSAGLVAQLRNSVSHTRMMMYGVDLYPTLEAETGVDLGWHQVGTLHLASSPYRLEALARQAGWARSFGLPVEIVSADEAHERFPLIDVSNVLGAQFVPTDGHLDPTGLTMALAEGAKRQGARMRTGERVLEIPVHDGVVTGVVTDHGTVEAEVVVNAAGIWANELGRLAGVEIPVVPMEHQYLITRPIDGVTTAFPTLRDPDNLVYVREEVGGLVVGGYERNPDPWHVDTPIPPDFNHRLLQEKWERFEPIAEGAFNLLPALRTTEINRFVNGPEAFTPDDDFILGETQVRGFFVAAGFCAHGITGGAGVGRYTAEWIVDGEPSMDLSKMDVRRFGAHYRSRRYALARAREIYAKHYDVKYPGEDYEAGRPLKVSPTYTRLEALGAEFGEKAGWERANWFGSNEDPAYASLRPRGWAGEHWSTAIVAEHVATRERAGLFDETSFAKLEVSGPQACAFLQRICANDVDVAEGRVVYTQMLNRRGGIQCDLTVTRLDQDRYRIITGTASGSLDLAWITKQRGEGDRVEVRDVTSSLACLGVWGPRARDILTSVCPDDLSNEGFPFMTSAEITVGNIPCRALRVTYVGELGWELYAPSEFGASLWDTLVEAGEPHGMVPAGYRAIDSLRLEKGYRAWGSDVTPDDSPLEAGLAFAVASDKEFLGKTAFERVRTEGARRRLACLVLTDPRSSTLGNEPVRANGAVVARVTSGGIGHTIGASIAYAYLPSELAVTGTWLEVEVFGEWIGAEVADEPFYDPKGERIRA